MESDIFNKILELVEDKCSIQKACEKHKINRSSFYKSLTKEQKSLLDIARISNSYQSISFKKRKESTWKK